MENLDFLVKLGIAENEILVYKTLLNHGQLTVKNLIDHTNIKKGNLYNILYNLSEKKLVEEFDKEKIKHFRALNPSNLKNYASGVKDEIVETSLKLEQMMPDLMQAFQSSSSKPIVYYFYGQEGFENLQNKIMKEARGVYNIIGDIKISDDYKKQIGKYYKKRFAKNIKTYQIAKKDLFKTDNIKVKLLEKFSGNNEVTIYDSTVIFTTYNNGYLSTLIHSKEISHSFKSMFEILWSVGSSPQKSSG